MLRRRFSPVLLSSLALALTGLLHSQTAEQAAKAATAFQANARAVLVDVVVTDRNGRPVQGLHEGAFQVEEDGHGQKITSFEEHAGTQAITRIPAPLLAALPFAASRTRASPGPTSNPNLR
jgi:hypothetical protein